ncbi:MAG: hypothetical protein IPJ87_17655 [Flavobacteriales bacterium]|nr:hypothetical protein [Flavobacteriales bacterium]MBK7943671.1 hypothetical protein [Flavobacteriales bacterium]MBK8950520.1 hypothetical protein [Flavobacteriales bacterium]MBK9699645.1 hypothetical protein [Flavobacteriales bacterium]
MPIDRFFVTVSVSAAAIEVLHLSTGVPRETLQNTLVMVNQELHNNVTGFSDRDAGGGAITLGLYIFFTGNYGDPQKQGDDVAAWMDLLSHEIGHRVQADRMGPWVYPAQYGLEVLEQAKEIGSLDSEKLKQRHDDMPMEKEAEGLRTKYRKFMKLFDYEGIDRSERNAMLDILGSEWPDSEKPLFIQDAYQQETSPTRP